MRHFLNDPIVAQPLSIVPTLLPIHKHSVRPFQLENRCESFGSAHWTGNVFVQPCSLDFGDPKHPERISMYL